MANNVSHKGLQEITKELQRQGLKSEAKKLLEYEEVANNWKKLASIMGSHK